MEKKIVSSYTRDNSPDLKNVEKPINLPLS